MMMTIPPHNKEASLLVQLGSRSYTVHIGTCLLDRAGMLVMSILQQKHVFIITDTNVKKLYLQRLQISLEEHDIHSSPIILPYGEYTKSFTILEELLNTLLAARCERRTALIALGGGVIGDLTGFAAAILLRGIDLIHIPTTLLAQVDSAIGGKTGINTHYGKNLIGAFHQPRIVLIDISTLNTLPIREIRAGYAEVVKYGCIDTPSFFNWLEIHGSQVLAGDLVARHYAVLMSCAAKARAVSEDERETGKRALLNLGHTFGHALEVETAFGPGLRHGEAVSVGMMLAFNLSVRLGLCPAAEADRLRNHLTAVGLPVTIRQVLESPPEPTRLLAHMTRDKKVKNGRMTFVLARGIGRSFLNNTVETDQVLAVLAESVRT